MHKIIHRCTGDVIYTCCFIGQIPFDMFWKYTPSQDKNQCMIRDAWPWTLLTWNKVYNNYDTVPTKGLVLGVNNETGNNSTGLIVEYKVGNGVISMSIWGGSFTHWLSSYVFPHKWCLLMTSVMQYYICITLN